MSTEHPHQNLFQTKLFHKRHDIVQQHQLQSYQLHFFPLGIVYFSLTPKASFSCEYLHWDNLDNK